jgi:hypothetical protein
LLFIIKADCAKEKAERDSINNPRLTRTFDKWKADNFKLISSLVKSVMYPISRLRLESHVVVIHVKELSNGFRVLSTEAVSIESLTAERAQSARDIILASETDHPEDVCCGAILEVESIDAAYDCFYCCGLGKYTNLASIQDKAANLNGHRVELIKMINKEI